MAKVIDRDRGYKALRARMAKLKGSEAYTKVGVLAGGKARDKGSVSNVDLAIIHEFGTKDGHIPERAWLRSAFDRYRDKWADIGTRLSKKVIDGMPVPQALELLGLQAAADVKKNITTGEGIPPPNAPSTIRRKGSSRPLVDTGQLVASITHLVVTDGGGGE